MKMHILPGGRLRMRRSVFYPDAQRDETMDLPVSCYLLRHAQGNVLFDSGCHPDTSTDPVGRWGVQAKFLNPLHRTEDTVVHALGSLGLKADDIDLVINSHLHTDHCGCNGFFRRATMICHTRELEPARSPLGAAIGRLPQDWDHSMPFRTFEGQHDVFGDGRIVLLSMPGHTPGMSCALTSLDRSGTFLLTSDAVAIKDHLDQGIHPRQTWDHDAASTSMDEIRRIGASGATIVFGHDDAQWQTMKKGEQFYD
jgi:glyoxylase-like metal-dependent hydrolase (beta-lactamase superfamily II)